MQEIRCWEVGHVDSKGMGREAVCEYSRVAG